MRAAVNDEYRPTSRDVRIMGNVIKIFEAINADELSHDEIIEILDMAIHVCKLHSETQK